MFCSAALPAEATTPAQVTAWKAHLAALPPLPLVGAAKASFNKQKIAPILKGDGFPTTDKGQRSNSENTEMYPLRRIQPPFRFARDHDTVLFSGLPREMSCALRLLYCYTSRLLHSDQQHSDQQHSECC